MTKQPSDLSAESGFALVYMAGALTVMILFTGLAVDSGRAYVLKAQLTKAVDGAALGAAPPVDPPVELLIFVSVVPDGQSVVYSTLPSLLTHLTNWP